MVWYHPIKSYFQKRRELYKEREKHEIEHTSDALKGYINIKEESGEKAIDRIGKLKEEGIFSSKEAQSLLNRFKKDIKKRETKRLEYFLANDLAVILLLISAAIFISNSNSPTGYAIFSSNILTLNLSPILGILSLIVALILLMNKE